MNDITTILNDVSHRPWEIPKGNLAYYQEWNDALFLHFRVDEKNLQELVPAEIELDTFQGKTYVSVVCFRMEQIRPIHLPAVGFLSNFYEINVRTYVKKGDKAGVYFLNIETEKAFSAWVARTLSGLPYEKSIIKRTNRGYTNANSQKNFHLDVGFNISSRIEDKTPFDLWLTERYCLYLKHNNNLYRYQIHHREWQLNSVKLYNVDMVYQLGAIELSSNNLVAVHYSRELPVVSWKREKIL